MDYDPLSDSSEARAYISVLEDVITTCAFSLIPEGEAQELAKRYGEIWLKFMALPAWGKPDGHTIAFQEAMTKIPDYSDLAYILIFLGEVEIREADLDTTEANGALGLINLGRSLLKVERLAVLTDYEN